jgi:hypothetical protein
MNTTTANPTISISGVLRRPCCPDWIPHDDRATETEALDRIIAHMQIDALEPALMHPQNGPLSWTEHNVNAFGNFTLCSARFEIRCLSVVGYQRLKAAWLIHRDSPQYRISLELSALHKNCEDEVADMVPTSFRTSYEAEKKRSLIRSKYRLKSQRLEIRLQAIYERRTP